MKKTIFFNIHSLIDVITNSSTELFIVDVSKNEGVIKEIFEFLVDHSNGDGYDESRIEKFCDYKYKDDYIIPENINEDNLFACDIEHSDSLLEALINKYFSTINLEYKND